MHSPKPVSTASVTRTENDAPCADAWFRKLCAQSASSVPRCPAAASRETGFQDRAKLLRGRADCLDLFALKEELLQGGRFRFKASGWCMFPTLKKGDRLQVEAVRPEQIKIGDVAVYRSGNKLYAHRVLEKQLIDGKPYVFTRPDKAEGSPEAKNGQRVPGEQILGIIKRIERGRQRLSPEKRPEQARDRFLFKTQNLKAQLRALGEKFLLAALASVQSCRLYQAFGAKLTRMLEPHFSFELSRPLTNKQLRQIYSRSLLKVNEKIPAAMLNQSPQFHIVIKLHKATVGLVSFLNRPACCPHPGFWVSDVYIRLKYRNLGLEQALLKKTKQILPAEALKNYPPA